MPYSHIFFLTYICCSLVIETLLNKHDECWHSPLCVSLLQPSSPAFARPAGQAHVSYAANGSTPYATSALLNMVIVWTSFSWQYIGSKCEYFIYLFRCFTFFRVLLIIFSEISEQNKQNLPNMFIICLIYCIIVWKIVHNFVSGNSQIDYSYINMSSYAFFCFFLLTAECCGHTFH